MKGAVNVPGAGADLRTEGIEIPVVRDGFVNEIRPGEDEPSIVEAGEDNFEGDTFGVHQREPAS